MVNLQEKKYYGEQRFSSEKISVIEVSSLDEFGHYLALDLLAWIDKNREGVISLPTGRTPESFIRALEWYRNNWNSDSAQKNIRKWGINSVAFPETRFLTFVQMDEFLWMSPDVRQSYAFYILNYYISVLQIPRENCLLMDFSKMGFDLDIVRSIVEGRVSQESRLESDFFQKAIKKVQLFCLEYERKITALGGIGYFLGGIGLDGHIAFNVSGSSVDSVTRIVELNKKSKAGFKRSDQRFNRAVTIGLKTILQKSDASIILAAVGKEKAGIVQSVVEGPIAINIPASILQNYENSKFVLTAAAAGKLKLRGQYAAQSKMNRIVSLSLLEKLIVRLSLRTRKRILDLKVEDFEEGDAKVLVQKIKSDLHFYLKAVVEKIEQKIERGLQSWGNKKILHTAPHHDDIMLGYYPVVVRNKEANHQMAYVVSGSNGISDEYLYKYLKLNEKGSTLIKLYEKKGAFGENRSAILAKMEIREKEAELLWKKSPVKCGVTHLRSPFYNASYFKSQPTYRLDVAPCLNLINKFSPEVIFVLNDSEFQGPNTHHASFKIVMDAIKRYTKPVVVWGYRNVWDRYRVDEAELIISVSQSEYDEQHRLFIDCFTSQKKALYPSKSGSEPFSVYTQQTQKNQYQEVLVLLGKDYFESHADARVRSAVGFVFLERIGIYNKSGD